MKKKPELRQLRQLRITEAIFLKKNLNYVNYVITPITQLQKRQNHPLVLPLVETPHRHSRNQKQPTHKTLVTKILCSREQVGAHPRPLEVLTLFSLIRKHSLASISVD